MKKIIYLAVLALELFFSAIFTVALLSNNLYITTAIVALVVLGLLIWQIVRIAKAKTSNERWAVLYHIALILLIPIVVYIISMIVVAITLIIAFI